MNSAKLFRILRKVRAIHNLYRMGMAPLTISVILIGYYLGRSAPEARHVLVCAFVGLCAHMFGFGMNDVLDYEIDRFSPLRQVSPLVDGSLKLPEAAALAILPAPAALLLYYFTGGGWYGTVLLCGSILLSLVYNLWSKQGPAPRLLAEVSLALSIGVLAISGALFQSDGLSPVSLAASAAICLVLLDLNSISSGLKDLGTDLQAEASSFVIAIGARVDPQGLVTLPVKLMQYAVLVKFLTMIVFAWVVSTLQPPWYNLLLAGLLMLYSWLHLRLMLLTDTFQGLQKSLPLLGGYFMYAALLTLLYPAFPTWLKVLTILLDILLLSIPLRVILTMMRKQFILVQ